MDNDDKQVGRILTRREALALFGVAGAGVVASRVRAQSGLDPIVSTAPGGTPWMPACVVTPAQTEGPYFVDEKLNRVDIRPDPGTGKVSAGAPLDLEMRVFRVGNGACEPMAGAMVDIWQCDAMGLYSDVKDMNGFFNTAGQKFLRGYQTTNSSGIAKFTTVYPGWYEGRSVHIHFKVRTDAGASSGLEFTSQLFFDDDQSKAIYASGSPYSGTQDTLNSRDSIYGETGGQTQLDLTGDAASGFTSTIAIGVQA